MNNYWRLKNKKRISQSSRSDPLARLDTQEFVFVMLNIQTLMRRLEDLL